MDGGSDLTCALRILFKWIISLILFLAWPHKQKCHEQCGVAWNTDGLEGPWAGKKRKDKTWKMKARPCMPWYQCSPLHNIKSQSQHSWSLKCMHRNVSYSFIIKKEDVQIHTLICAERRVGNASFCPLTTKQVVTSLRLHPLSVSSHSS